MCFGNQEQQIWPTILPNIIYLTIITACSQYIYIVQVTELLLLLSLFHMDYLYILYASQRLYNPPLLYLGLCNKQQIASFLQFSFPPPIMSLDKGYQHLLISQPPNPAVILTRSREFHTYMSHWDFLMPPSFNRCWTCPMNNPEYAAGNPFLPTSNSHCITTVIAYSLCQWMVPFDVCDQLLRWSHTIFWSSQIFITTLLIHTYPNDFYPKSSKKDCCIAVISLLANIKQNLSHHSMHWEYTTACRLEISLWMECSSSRSLQYSNL